MENNGIIRELILRFLAVEEDTAAFSLYDGEAITNVTYRKFAADILKAAGYFRHHNIKNQHIAISAPNSYDWMVTFFAVTASGNVAVLMNPDLSEDILLWQCSKADVSVICGDEQVLSKLEMWEPNIQCVVLNNLKTVHPMLHLDEIYCAAPNETVMMMFTSGTTGKSKAVEITSANLWFSVENFKEQYTHAGMERAFTPIPFYHILGFLHVIETLNYHRTVCIGRGIKYIFMDMAPLNPTAINAVPSIVDSLAKLLKNAKTELDKQKYIGKSLHTITYGGAVLKQATSKFLMDMGFSISVFYGMTEVSCTATWGVLDQVHTESAGKFCKYIQYRFQDGELMMTGPTLMKGYYKDEEETARVIEDGWLHTGDLGYCDEDGYFYITGRKKNVIILSNGENVNPEEIEATFSKCEAIKECLVYSDGKGICADVFAMDQDAAAVFIKEYNESMPMYRQVYKVNYTTEPLPKTGSGKIKRKENK